jgi:RNA-binding protein
MNFILEFIGTILHLAKSGRMIIRVKEKLEPGTLLIDANEKKVGKVVEMIGAVGSPYASAIPLNSNTTNIAGVKVGISSLVRNNVERKRYRYR